MPAPVIVGIATASRIAYTAHSRRGEPEILPTASNADTDSETNLLTIPALTKEVSADSTSSSTADQTFSQAVSSTSSLSSQELIDQKKEDPVIVTTFTDDSDLNEDDIRPVTSRPTRPIAIFPQYLTISHTKITMIEAPLPHRGGTFSVINASNTDTDNETELLKVRPGTLSFSERRYIVDPSTNQDIMCIRQDVGKLPRSYRFDDPTETKILDLQGNFFNLVKGPKSTALFTNALDGKPARLHMQGSFKRRHARTKDLDTDEVLVSMTSEIWNARSFGGRRTYEVEVAKGVDLVLVVGMIVALDARGSFVGPGQFA